MKSSSTRGLLSIISFHNVLVDKAKGPLKAVCFSVNLTIANTVWLQPRVEYFSICFSAEVKSQLLFMDLSIQLGTFVSCSNVHCLLLENERILLSVVIILHFL